MKATYGSVMRSLVLSGLLAALIVCLIGCSCGCGEEALAAETEVKAAGIPGIPKRSDVCFSSRWKHPRNADDPYETFAMARAFHATRLDWVYTSDAAFIAEAKEKGYPLIATLNATMPDAPGRETYQVGRGHNSKGELIAAPWMTWKPTPYMGCVNSPEYKRNILSRAVVMLNAGAAGLQYDDPDQNINMANWDGCYCVHCDRKFTAYLRDHLSPDELRDLKIDPAAFSYKAYINAGGDSTRLRELFVDFQRESVEAYQTDIHDTLEKQYGRQIAFSCNNFDIRWRSPYNLFDYGVCELPARSQNPGAIYTKMREALALGKVQVVTLHCEDVPLSRKLIGTVCALGGNPIVPWDVWIKGEHRYYGKPDEYADLYGMIRAIPRYLDGYITIAASGKDIPAEDASRQVRTDNPDIVAVMQASVRNPSAPLTVHLIDWSDAPASFTLTLDKAFLGRKVKRAALIVPSPYNAAEHERAEAAGVFDTLIRTADLAVTDEGDSAAITVPAVGPWGVALIE